jgi:microcystin-dependent protein
MSDPYIGEIRMFGGNFAPNGWLFCDGSLLAISDYDTLFNLIGTTYGGDGQTNFAIPNLASRVPVHTGNGYPLNQSGGAEAVSLSTQQLPTHTHVPQAANTAGSFTSPNAAFWASWGDGQYSTATGTPVAMSSAALLPSGGNQPHNNMPPYLAVNFIISLFGIYPSPS